MPSFQPYCILSSCEICSGKTAALTVRFIYKTRIPRGKII